MVKIASPHTGKSFEFTFGADPEVFVKKGGAFVSAHGLIPGTKKAPMPVKGGAVQVDGMALEFNTNPATSFKEFNASLDAALDSLKSMVPGYELCFEPVAHFSKEYLASQPKEAVELGCEPDFNAYTKAPNPRPDANKLFRTASGHVHIGWTSNVDPNDPTHFEACCVLTKKLDAYLGIPSLVWDDDDERRQLYGKAGAFRPKPYGMEYRVLSNAWLRLPRTRKLVVENSILAIKAAFSSPNNEKRYGGMYPVDILEKKPGWEDAVGSALEHEGIPPSSKYA